MESPKLDLFVSYSRNDIVLVRKLVSALKASKLHVWWDEEDLPSRGANLRTEVKTALSQANRILLIVTSSSMQSAHVNAEWTDAYVQAKAIVPILLDGDPDLIPTELKGLFYLDWRTRDFDTISTEFWRFQGAPPRLGTLIGIGSLPTHHVPRLLVVHEVRELLIADSIKPVTASSSPHIVMLCGMGGLGKTVLATSLAADYQIRFAFPDGIVMIRLGGESIPSKAALDDQLREKVLEAGRFLGVSPNYSPDLGTAIHYLKVALAEKQCLLILDDVRAASQLTPFRQACGPSCRILLTTRQPIRLSQASHTFSLDLLSEAEAKDLFLRTAGLTEANFSKTAASLLAACDRLPIAISMVGAPIQGNVLRCKTHLAKLRSARLHEIPITLGDYPYTSLLHVLQTSVEAVGEAARQCLLDLAAFREDALLPEVMLQRFWKRHRRLQSGASDIIDELVGHSLLLRFDDRHVFLHDLTLTYLRGTCGDLRQLHRDILNSYSAGGDLTQVRDDGYYQKHLLFHLTEAKQEGAIHQVLRSTTPSGQNSWFEARSATGSVGGFISDLLYGWTLAGAATKKDSRKEVAAPSIATEARYGLMLSSINSTAQRLPRALVPELVRTKIWTPEQALAYVRSIPEPSFDTPRESGNSTDGVMMQTVGSSYGRPPGTPLDTTLVGEAYAPEYPNLHLGPPSAASVIGALCAVLPSSLHRDAVLLAQGIPDPFNRGRALTSILPHVDHAFHTFVLDGTLAAIDATKNRGYRSYLITCLARHLPSSYLGATIERAARLEHSKGERGFVTIPLEALALRCASVNRLDTALLAIRSIQYPPHRSQAIGSLASLGLEALIQPLFQEALLFTSHAIRSNTLIKLAGFVPPAMRNELLAALDQTEFADECTSEAVPILEQMRSFDEQIDGGPKPWHRPKKDRKKEKAYFEAWKRWSKILLYGRWGMTEEVDRALPDYAPGEQDLAHRQAAFGALAASNPKAAIQQASAISDPSASAFLIWELIPRLRSAQRTAATSELRSRIGQMAHSFDRELFLTSIAPLDQLASRVRDLDDAARKDPDPERCLYLLILLARRLPAKSRPGLLGTMLGLSEGVGGFSRTGAMLREIAELLPTHSRGAAIENMVKAAVSRSPASVRADCWSMFAPLLSRGLLASALALETTLRDQMNAVFVLAAIAPELARFDAVDEALKLAEWIHQYSDYYYAEALAGILPYVDESRCHSVAEQAISAARAEGSALEKEKNSGVLDAGLWKVKAISLLLPNVPPDLRENLAQEGLSEAMAMVNIWAGSEARWHIAQALGMCGYYDEAMQAALEIHDENDYKESIIHALAQSSEPALLRALAFTREYPFFDKEVLRAIAPLLREDILRQIAKQAFEDFDQYARAATVLVPYLPADLVLAFFKLAAAEEDDEIKRECFAPLAKRLEELDLKREARIARQSLRGDEGREYRYREKKDNPDQIQAYRIIAEAFDRNDEDAVKGVQDALRALSTNTRAVFHQGLRFLVPALADIGRLDGLREVTLALQEVQRAWP